MFTDGFRIRYKGADDTLFDQLFSGMIGADPEELGEEEPVRPLSTSEAQQVYRLKAYLVHRTGLWRRIEIQGEQTLADLSSCLVDAFNHDSDLLGGFWKLVRRGNSIRVCEVELGDVDPFGDGSGAAVRIVNIDWELGEEIKYVYDFGDWIEHRLFLEALVPAEQAETSDVYPRFIAKNEPRYQNCKSCLIEGKKVVATWICIDCSNSQQKDFVLCEECASKYHEDHYSTEILY